MSVNALCPAPKGSHVAKCFLLSRTAHSKSILYAFIKMAFVVPQCCCLRINAPNPGRLWAGCFPGYHPNSPPWGVFRPIQGKGPFPSALCHGGHVSMRSWLLRAELGHASKCLCCLRKRLNWGVQGGNICGNGLIVSKRILSNQDASVCFPEPRADINNVAWLALCRLAEEC